MRHVAVSGLTPTPQEPIEYPLFDLVLLGNIALLTNLPNPRGSEVSATKWQPGGLTDVSLAEIGDG
jgi:hypothetical protein